MSADVWNLEQLGLGESIALLRSLTTEDIDEISAEVIDDHLGFIARNADDLANLELGLMRLERAAHTPDDVIDQIIEVVFSEQKIQLREVA